MLSVVMTSLRVILTAPFHRFIHEDFHEAVAKMTLIDAFLFLVLPLMFISLCNIILLSFFFVSKNVKIDMHVDSTQ
jgi:hypothetical protein